ncbi:MAG: Ig-like domain-containing protein [Firmicutes bacterium]|nr:Ig-like domain-containing protein [Bacillota bacterium]
MTEKTMRNVYDVERLASADEMFSEMLLYLRDHSIFIPVKGAAGDLYDVIHGGYLRQLDYATTELQNAATDKAVDLVLEGAAKALPYGEVIKESFDFAGGVSTIVFNTGNTQKQKDNMRCVAYIGECLSEWLLDNKGKYSSQSGQDKEICAKKTMYAYYMLLKTRMAGEESLQKMMELSKPTWKKAYTLSLEASSILRSNEEWLKSDGVLSHICTSVIACPVDVEIRDASGKLIQTVHDGTPVEGYVKDIYYCVAYQPLDQDYVKIIRFPSDKGYTLKCIGTGLGTVDYSLTTIAENGINTRKESKSIPVKKGSTVEISGMSENKPDCVLREDGKTIEYQVNIADEYIAAQSLQCKEKNVALTEGEKKRIDVVISPINASIQEVAWTSSALSVATVNADGVVTALGQGETTIQAKTVDGGFTAQCKVIVGEKTINQNPPTSNGSHSPNMANNQSDKTEISTAKVKKPKKVTLKKAKSIKRGALKLTWKRDKKVTGYQAVVATDKKFKKNKKSAFITKNKTVTKTFTKLKRKKAYFAKVRAYKKVGKTKVYGAYSKVKKVKVR